MEQTKLWGRRVVFSESLLLQARKSPNLVRGIERHLNAFMLEATAKVRAPATPCVMAVHLHCRKLTTASNCRT